MNAQALDVLSWRPVVMTPAQLQAALHNFEFIGRSVIQDPETSMRSGAVIWGMPTPIPTAIAWHWGEVRRFVPAISDTMTIQSNITLVDDSSSLISDEIRLLRLHSIIYQLPWLAEMVPYLELAREKKRRSAQQSSQSTLTGLLIPAVRQALAVNTAAWQVPKAYHAPTPHIRH